MSGPETPTAAPEAPLRVLVIDDNRDAADSLALLLGLSGHAVKALYDGRTALSTLEDWPAHAVFIDIGMPDMNGWAVASALRQCHAGARMTLIALSGWGSPQDVQRSLEAGFDLHLTKPALPERLDEALAYSAARVLAA